MSAFVVSTSCINRVVAVICGRGEYGPIVRQFDGIDTQSRGAATEIGRRLLSLNIEAVMQRYPDTQDNPAALPGDTDALWQRDHYKAAAGRAGKLDTATLIDGVKALQCLAYQCSEGDVTETPLFRELTAAAGTVALEVVRRQPAYSQAEWG